MPVREVQAKIAKLDKKPETSSAIDLFMEVCPCPIIGVTGTKGKGTTSTLIAAALKQVNKHVFVGANIARPVFEFIDELTKDSIVILELSSFQLEDIKHSPHIAVILPVTEDHLQPLSEISPNYHLNLGEYVSAKAQLTAFQGPTDLLVYALDSPTTKEIADNSNARRIGVGRNPKADLTVSIDGKISENGHQLMDLAKTGLRGEHVFLDAALAVAIGREFGVTEEQMEEAFSHYETLPHRLQTIGKFNDVTYIDDSYATAPDAAMAAIKAFNGPVIWIGGGSKKGASFDDLARIIKESHIKLVILLGEEADRLKQTLGDHGFDRPIIKVSQLVSAVEEARRRAVKGDTVLLSPACASKDMFKNAAERGEIFTKAVLEGKDGGISV